MKKKSPNNSPFTKVKQSASRPPICDTAGVQSPALGGIALRVLISDIRKHKLGDENAPEIRARGFEETAEKD